MKVTVYEISPTGTPSLIAIYGQPEEFNNALPNILGPLPSLIRFERRLIGRDASLMIVEKIMADGELVSSVYRVEIGA